MAQELPTFDAMRSNAFALLGDAEDELRSDWREGHGPNHEQAEALQRKYNGGKPWPTVAAGELRRGRRTMDVMQHRNEDMQSWGSGPKK